MTANDPASPASSQQANQSADDRVALKMARDELAVELLTNRVLTQARAVVFAEQRGLALAAAAILAVFGITSWMSIDDKVHMQVDKRIDATVSTKVKTVQEKTDALEQLSTKTEAELKELDATLAKLKSTADKARQDIEREVASVRELREALARQAQTVPRQPGETDAEIAAAFGPIPANTSIITGSAVRTFGLGSDTPTGGAFTTEFLKASRSQRADANGDHIISVAEATHETRRLLAMGLFKQEPTFAGDDVGLFRLSTAESSTPQGRILAVVVGLGTLDPAAHSGQSWKLRGPPIDVGNVTARLEDQATINRQTSVVTSLIDQNATWRAVESAITELSPTAEDIVLVYFSGHGSKQLSTEAPGQFSLTVYFYDQAVAISRIVKLLEALNARHRILIIDA